MRFPHAAKDAGAKESCCSGAKLFVYEFITGGGTWSLGGAPEGSLLREGQAMAAAVVEDALRMGAQPLVLRDARLTHWQPANCECLDIYDAADSQQQLQRLAAIADWTLVIAPEFSGALLDLSRTVLEAGGRLLSPGVDFVRVASDKQRTVKALAQAGVPTPQGILLQPAERPPDAFPYPAVLKPHDGAGSWLVRRVDHAAEAVTWIGQTSPRPWRLERFCQGLAASVAVLSGPAAVIALPPCSQHLNDDGSFAYLGGETPLPQQLAGRAKKLALAAVHALPKTTGYVGVDLLLGGIADGSQDYVIEINPRLTTSYTGLRAACRQNLLQAMIDVACGRQVALSFRDERVEFLADGTVNCAGAP